MEESQGLFHQLLHKKLVGEINKTEELEFQKLMRATSENELLFHRMEDVYQKGIFNPRVKGQQSSFDRLSRQLDFEEGMSHAFNKKSRNWQKWYRIAVVFIVLVTAISIFYLNISSSQYEIVKFEMIQKTNPAGQKTRINLPDGSVCWLNSDSEIQFNSNFSDSARNIQLRGEAYFEVAKDTSRPFRVHTEAMSVTALGTIFNVNSFPEGQLESVSLLEGKISVRCDDTFYKEVLPGESIGYHKASRASDKLDLDPNEAIAWKDGVLNFNEESYTTIFAKLERWYGVNIKILGNVPLHMEYKARFQNELLSNILESMRYGHDFDFRINGKNIEIKFN